MSELKLGFLANVQNEKEDNLAQKIHLLIIRILLYYCYNNQNILWGYHIFRSGWVDLIYKKLSPQNIAVKSAQRLLSDLCKSASDQRPGKIYKDSVLFQKSQDEKREAEVRKNNSAVVRSWEEVLTLVSSDFSWEEDAENFLFILTSSAMGSSDRIRSMTSHLKKEKKVTIVYLDISYLEGLNSRLDIEQPLSSKTSKEHPCVVPSEFLCCDLAVYWFRQVLRSFLLNKPRSPSHQVSLQGLLATEDQVTVQLFPLDEAAESHTQISELIYEGMVINFDQITDYLRHENCFFVVLDKELMSLSVTSFVVSSRNDGNTSFYCVQQFPGIGAALLCGMNDCFDQLWTRNGANSTETQKSVQPQFDLYSLHDVAWDCSGVEAGSILPTTDDSELMTQIRDFHNLNIDEAPNRSLATTETKQCELETLLESSSCENPANCASDEAMSQSSPLFYQRNNIISLVRKHQNDIKLELVDPTELKRKYSNNQAALVKQHKIQVVLHLVWYCEFTSCTAQDMEDAKDGTLSLLRSLSFLTSPNEMFKFLNDQIVEEFHGDCGELLRSIYEDGFLMEIPDILCSDSNSLNSSVLSLHLMNAPLYCEDTTSSQSTDQMSSSQSNFTRQRSWMDPCQLSQSSFSIKVPKSSKRKKKRNKLFSKPERDDPNKIAAMVCSQKQSGVHARHLSSDTTPDEVKQSSKRRKFTRKNSVLDTPLKKQVKNPTTAKTSRARQRDEEVTPQKSTTPVVHESPVRGVLSRASSFFGSQTQPPAMKSFIVKDGFKTPTRPPARMTPSSSTEDIPSLFRSPEHARVTPPHDSQHSSQNSSQHSSQPSSQHSFTPPGTPKSARKMIKRLSYNSPIRTLFASGTFDNFQSPRRKPLDSDFVQMKPSPSGSLSGKENEPFISSFKYFDEPTVRRTSISEALTNALEPIFNPRPDEDAQMPSFQPSPCQGTLNLQSRGGFLKLLEDSSSVLSHESNKKYSESDNESDISAASSSTHRSILKSPFNQRHRHRRRERLSVSFSLDADVHFSSDNESECSGRNTHILNLLNVVDDNINGDEEPETSGDTVNKHPSPSNLLTTCILQSSENNNDERGTGTEIQNLHGSELHGTENVSDV